MLDSRAAFAFAWPFLHGADYGSLFAWNGDPFLLLSLTLAVWLYGLGLIRVWRKAGVSRGVTASQATGYYAGLAATFFALVSPLDAMSDQLFWVHMVQHLMLIFIAAPLMTVSAAPVAITWGLPASWRPALGRWWNDRSTIKKLVRRLGSPLAAWTLYAATLWLWHMPLLYEAAIHNETLHIIEHLSFILSALLFWWVLAKIRHKIPTALFYLFTTALHSGLLGLLITFASQPWYTHYLDSTRRWGLSPLEDQQIAGAVMWIPAGFIYLLIALGLLWKELQARERKDENINRAVKEMPGDTGV